MNAENKMENDKSKYLEKLTPENSVLVLVDYLTGFLPAIQTIEHDIYQMNVTALCRLSQIYKDRIPTIVLGDEGGFRGDFFDQIGEYVAHGQRIERHTPSAWHAAEFRQAIEKASRPKIIMAGISIDNCVTHTTLDLLKAGYQVYVLPDVSGTDSKLVEDAAISRLVQAGTTMTNWGCIASELMDDWENPEGDKIGELYKKYSKWGGN